MYQEVSGYDELLDIVSASQKLAFFKLLIVRVRDGEFVLPPLVKLAKVNHLLAQNQTTFNRVNIAHKDVVSILNNIYRKLLQIKDSGLDHIELVSKISAVLCLEIIHQHPFDHGNFRTGLFCIKWVLLRANYALVEGNLLYLDAFIRGVASRVGEANITDDRSVEILSTFINLNIKRSILNKIQKWKVFKKDIERAKALTHVRDTVDAKLLVRQNTKSDVIFKQFFPLQYEIWKNNEIKRVKGRHPAHTDKIRLYEFFKSEGRRLAVDKDASILEMNIAKFLPPFIKNRKIKQATKYTSQQIMLFYYFLYDVFMMITAISLSLSPEASVFTDGRPHEDIEVETMMQELSSIVTTDVFENESSYNQIAALFEQAKNVKPADNKQELGTNLNGSAHEKENDDSNLNFDREEQPSKKHARNNLDNSPREEKQKNLHQSSLDMQNNEPSSNTARPRSATDNKSNALKFELKERAIKHFKGEGNKDDLRKYKSWYSTQTLEDLVFANQSKQAVVRYILLPQDATTSFIKQIRQLNILKNRLKQPIAFIATEPGSTETSHFIFGLLFDKTLLIINPIGKTRHQSFYRVMNKVKEDLRFDNIYFSSTPIQRDKSGHVSCGPICVELMRHLAPISIAYICAILNALKVEQEEREFKEDDECLKYKCQWIDISSSELLPETLSLKKLSGSDSKYQAAMQEIRLSHLNILEVGSYPPRNEQGLINELILGTVSIDRLDRDPRYQQLVRRGAQADTQNPNISLERTLSHIGKIDSMPTSDQKLPSHFVQDFDTSVVDFISSTNEDNTFPNVNRSSNTVSTSTERRKADNASHGVALRK